MNNQATVEKMRSLRLYGMVRAFESLMESGSKKKLTPDETVGFLIDSEWDEKEDRKLIRLVKQAQFRYQASFAEIEFGKQRSLDKNMIMRLSNCQWVKKAQNIIVTGPTGAGKSYIASALGYQACEYGYRVLYYNCLKLFTKFRFSETDGSYQKEINKIRKADLLILDDFGLKYMETQERLLLLEIMEDRHGKGSTVIASQLPVSKWHQVIKDSTIADAICDRIVHTAHRIAIECDTTMRKKVKKTRKT